MANGYASNIPLEEVAPPPPLLAEGTCIICKRRHAAEGADMCERCAKALAA
jgi:hypothetical protein